MENELQFSLLNDPDMKEIFESFVIETKEILEKLDLNLVDLEKRSQDTELLNDIFRSFHTVKGTAGFLGLDKLTFLTHHAEDILNKLRKLEVLLDDEIMNAILLAYDSMKELVLHIESNKNEEINVDEAVEALKIVLSRCESKSAAQSDIEIETQTTAIQSGEIQNKVSELVEVDEIPDLTCEITPEKINISKQEKIIEAAHKKGDNTIRVDVERLDELVNIVSELVLGRNRLSQIYHEASIDYEGTKLSRDLAETSRHMDLMTTELQLAVMKTRMIKIGKVFNKFPRLVRDLSKETKKDIELVIHGEETELDKTLIEEINDPLVHLVRNSIDHGVELPEDRIKKQKPAKGTITLAAEHEGNNIIITIQDDGKGIDPEKIKEKAIEKGLLNKERAKELTKQEIFNLIFLPGFSTAEKVTNISGRGVGMDVVKTNITKLRGIINVDSEVDKGTKIILKLPLTLAIIQGLLVGINKETVIIPLNSVIEVVRVSSEQIHTINKKEVIQLRDSVLPLINIHKLLFKFASNGHDRTWQYVVVVGIAEKRFGIKVDMLLGQKEVVIKSLGSYLGNIQGIAGSTIMGDGKVVVILDLAELINNLRE
ncbi:MAG: chemotaxis protein CheA [Ignavibacteriales bacterium]|nr:chemotaxis protein CheA [Ignavibacteriales bacterium]